MVLVLTERPYICRKRVGFIVDHLWRRVVRCAGLVKSTKEEREKASVDKILAARGLNQIHLSTR